MRYVAIDFETFPFQPGLKAPWPVVLSVAVQSGDEVTATLHPWYLWSSRRLFLDLVLGTGAWAGCVLVGHNIAYDLAVGCVGSALDDNEQHALDAVFGAYRAGRVRDTQIRQELLDIAAGRRQEGGATFVRRGPEYERADYTLAGLEKLYLGRDRSAAKGQDAWRSRYGELYGKPLEAWPPDATVYPKDDAEGTLAVFLSQWREDLVGWGNCAPEYPDVVNEQEQVYAAWALFLTSCWGMRTDANRVAALEADVSARYSALQERMHREGLFKVGGTKKAPKLTKDMKAIRARVVSAFAERGLQAPVSPKGNIKTDADTMSQSGDELLEELGEGGPVSTVLKTFLPVLKTGTEHPINTNYSTLVNSGRVSSWKPNLANLPRSLGVRECYKARDGYVYSASDFNSAELRAWAQVCYWLFGFSDMRDFYLADPKGDPHLELAASIVGISPEEALVRKKAGDTDVKDARQMCKALNFSLPTAVGARKIAEIARKQYGVTMTEAEAKQRKNQWLRRWREGQRYYDWTSRNTRDEKSARLMQFIPGWREGALHRVRGGLGYTDFANTAFQGLVADAAKQGLCWLAHECFTGRTYDTDEPSPLAGCRLVAHVYDENILEVPEERGHEAAMRQNKVMIDGARLWIPDVPIEVEPTLMHYWSKAGEPVWKEGRLIPWTPGAKV